MKVLVCGGRDYNNRDKIYNTLYDLCDEFNLWSEPDELGNKLPSGIIIVNGAARGADQISSDWATVNWVPHREYKAEWDKWGKAAGVIRNQQMLDEEQPDLVIAFKGGRGTKHMVEYAKRAGVEVRTIDE